ncbi:MAG: hypothetical protein HUU08_07510 [Candidatus Brocadia sp.]|nr:hypothetical protein [Candidatus Brocadia sp.]
MAGIEKIPKDPCIIDCIHIIMEKKNVVGSNIRRFGLKSRITQEELALMSGLLQGYINQPESDER